MAAAAAGAVTYGKMGKALIFLPAQRWLGMDGKGMGSVLGGDAPGIFLGVCALPVSVLG